MARFTVVLPDSVAVWVKKSAKEENISQSAFVSNMLAYAMAGISRDIRIMDLEDQAESLDEEKGLSPVLDKLLEEIKDIL